jgi:hypothetical protein
VASALHSVRRICCGRVLLIQVESGTLASSTHPGNLKVGIHIFRQNSAGRNLYFTIDMPNKKTNITFFLNVTICSLDYGYRSCGEMCSLHAPWRWQQCIPPKFRYISTRTRLYDTISHSASDVRQKLIRTCSLKWNTTHGGGPGTQTTADFVRGDWRERHKERIALFHGNLTHYPLQHFQISDF